MQLSLHSFYLLENVCAFKAKSSKRESGGGGGIALNDVGAGRSSVLGGPWGAPEFTLAQIIRASVTLLCFYISSEYIRKLIFTNFPN